MPVAVQRRDHAGVAHCLDGHLAAAAQVVHHPLAPQLRAAFEVRRCHFLDLAASGGQPGGSLFDGGHRLVPQHAESLFAQAEAATGASLPQNAQGRVRRLPPMRPYWRTVSCACAAPTAARTSGSRCAASVEACSPSCGARRAAQTAAHLAGRAIPHAPVRQSGQWGRLRPQRCEAGGGGAVIRGYLYMPLPTALAASPAPINRPLSPPKAAPQSSGALRSQAMGRKNSVEPLRARHWPGLIA